MTLCFMPHPEPIRDSNDSEENALRLGLPPAFPGRLHIQLSLVLLHVYHQVATAVLTCSPCPLFYATFPSDSYPPLANVSFEKLDVYLALS